MNNVPFPQSSFRNALFEKGFIIPSDSWWYIKDEEKKSEPDHIMIGLYSHHGNTTCGEFKLCWTSIGIRLMAYDECWEILFGMEDFISYLREISKSNKHISIHEFCEHLKQIGFKDFTEREEKNIG